MRPGVDRKLPIVEPWFIVGGSRNHLKILAGPGTIVAARLNIRGQCVRRRHCGPGMFLDVAGTASVLACCTDTFVTDVETRRDTLVVSRG
jgi:hypothetical protein